ncbi:MAG: hypothetical protein NT155_01190 [Candidatus Staskawiczbacteria bacterium]|nr:hypothetical protein [Candidatus Staskawiczbacteria bacterium]
MNFCKKIFFILIIASLFYASGVLALKRAIFPDSSKLQPMPANVRPNISGNINSKTSSGATASKPGSLKNPTPLSPKEEGNQAPSNAGLAWIIFSIIIIFAIIIFTLRREKSPGNRPDKK